MKSIKELRKIDFKLSSTTLFFSRIKDLSKKKIDMDVYLPSKKCNLQREKVWTLQQKRELIMSIFIERWIPNICVMSLIDNDDEKEDIVQIIDGKQRLTTFIDFLNNEFSIVLEDKEYFFKDLPADYQNTYLYYDIMCQRAYEDYDRRFTDEDKIDWFKRINFFGTPQEVDHLNKLI